MSKHYSDIERNYYEQLSPDFVGPPRPPAPVYHGLSKLDIAGGIFSKLLFVIFGVCVVRLLTNGLAGAVSFSSFFEMLQNVPSIGFGWLHIFNTDFSNTFPVGFQWLGSVLDFFSDFFSFTGFLSTAGLNVIPFFFYFIRWIFVV